MTWEVWLARPTAPGAGPDARCGHPVGVIGPGTLDGAAWQAPFEHGLRTLVVTREKSALSDVIEGGGPIPALTRETRTARFDGARYRQAAPQSMTGRCYHCATWHCSGPEPLPAPPAAPRGAPR
ncbi:MAG: hypothetical protein U1F43_23050 [Myxococcota bacterium]